MQTEKTIPESHTKHTDAAAGVKTYEKVRPLRHKKMMTKEMRMSPPWLNATSGIGLLPISLNPTN